MKYCYGCKGCGKDTLLTLKCLKRLCIHYYGIGYLFCSPKIRAFLLESMKNFIDDLCEVHNNES